MTEAAPATISTFIAILLAALGVIISIILPVVRKALGLGGGAGVASSWSSRVWAVLQPYALYALFSLLVAVLVVAFMGNTFDTWAKALLAGYAWDSTLQKITNKP